MVIRLCSPVRQAIRIIGFICLACMLVATALVKARLPPREYVGLKSVLDFGGLRDVRYVLLVIGSFLYGLGCKMNTFGKTYCKLTDSQASTLLFTFRRSLSSNITLWRSLLTFWPSRMQHLSSVDWSQESWPTGLDCEWCNDGEVSLPELTVQQA